jgi:hypothetical protein
MNQDTIVKFIKSQVVLYDEEIRRNAQARLLAQHAHLVTSAGVSWLTEVTPEYNRSETKLVQERWRYRQEGDSIPLLPQVDEALDTRMKEAADVLTRLGAAAEIDYDYVENVLEPLTGQSEYRYWIARSVLQTPMLVDDDLAPLVQAPAPPARPVVPLAPASHPLVPVAAVMEDPDEPVATMIASTERAVPITTRIPLPPTLVVYEEE